MKNTGNKSIGFTLVEVLVSVGLFGLVSAGSISVYLMCQHSWHSTSLHIQATREAGLALNRLVYGVGTRQGLRAATQVTVNTNRYGYRSVGATNYPLTPNSTNHEVRASGMGNTPDGSWRMVVSNNSDGIYWVDYNRNASNIVLWGQANPTATASRLLIGNYIAQAQVTTSQLGWVTITLTTSNRHGRFAATNTVSTFVNLRNRNL